MKTEQIDKLYKECPKAMDAVEAYLGKHMNDVPALEEAADLKKQLGSNTRATAKLFLAMGERFLYEFFDGKELYIGVTPFGEEQLLSKFYWKIRYEKGTNKEHTNAIGSGGPGKSTRQEVESEAFENAFKLLESKLGQTDVFA